MPRMFSEESPGRIENGYPKKLGQMLGVLLRG